MKTPDELLKELIEFEKKQRRLFSDYKILNDLLVESYKKQNAEQHRIIIWSCLCCLALVSFIIIHLVQYHL